MSKRVLLVEGVDDEHVVKHVCGQRGLGRIDLIHNCGGKSRLLESVGTRLKESDIASLGLLLDADDDLLASWQAVSFRLVGAGYQMPASPPADGLVVPPPANTLLPKVGVWLMPDNKVPGILEDFLRFLVPDGDSMFEHARESLARIPEQDRRFSKLAEPKALLHTWLAWQTEPGRPFGQAIAARYLDPKLAGADVFARWLTKTFW